MLRLLSFTCCISFHPCLKEHFRPQFFMRTEGDHYIERQTRELNKCYAYYFNLTTKARRSLAERLGITHRSLSGWMLRKWNKKKKPQSDRTKQQLQTLHEQGHAAQAARRLYFTCSRNSNSIDIKLHLFSIHAHTVYLQWIPLNGATG